VINPDTVIAIRRLRRSLTVWRVVAVVALIVAAVAGLGQFYNPWPDAYVARISVSGIILDDSERLEALAEVATDPAAKALIVSIDSPGGTFVGGDRLYRAIGKVAEQRPVVAVMGSTGTSAAYMIALASNRIFVNQGTITGSIGVILQTANVMGLLDKLGIKPEAVKSGELKAQPNPLEPFSDKARTATLEVVEDLYRAFVDMVASERGLSGASLDYVTDGRIFAGTRAIDLNLVDAIGGEAAAREWLADVHNIGVDVPVGDITWGDDTPWGDTWSVAMNVFTSLFGGKPVFSERLNLDGVMSVWHASDL